MGVQRVVRRRPSTPKPIRRGSPGRQRQRGTIERKLRLPTLASPEPFPHGAWVPGEVEYVSGLGDPSSTKLEFRGSRLFPSQLQELCAMLQEGTSPQPFTLSFPRGGGRPQEESVEYAPAANAFTQLGSRRWISRAEYMPLGAVGGKVPAPWTWRFDVEED